MATKTLKLTARAVAAAKLPGYYGDGLNLWLQVSPAGTKSWLFRFTLNGRAREAGLGPVHTVPLAMAREKAAEYRRLLLDGVDPIEHKAQQRGLAGVAAASTITFDKACEQYIAAHEAGWRNPKHGAQWKATLETYCGPVVGKLPVAAVDTGLVMRCLEPIWRDKTETAKRLRGRIESVLDWATVRGYRAGDNPARWKGHLDKLLAAPNKIAKKAHFASMAYSDINSFMPKLREAEGMGARALEFCILGAARSGEVRGMTWAEVNLNEAVWVVPAERMKGNREHRVPLSKQALKLLKALPKVAGTGLVFPAPRLGALSDMTLTAVLRRMELPITVHGFRSTFSTWTAEATSCPSEVREACLAHVSGDKVSAAYQRGDFWQKRALHMQAWADYIYRPATAKVVPIGKRRTAK